MGNKSRQYFFFNKSKLISNNNTIYLRYNGGRAKVSNDKKKYILNKLDKTAVRYTLVFFFINEKQNRGIIDPFSRRVNTRFSRQ